MPDDKQQKVDKIDVKYVANLARLHLTEQETATFQGQLDQIVGYMKKISELDLDNIEPTSHAVSLQNVFREDIEKEGLDRDDAMKNAPVRVKDQYKVPKIIE